MRNCNAIPGRTMQNGLLGMSLDPKSQHRPHPKMGGLAGGCQISLCISESPSAGGAPQNGPSKGVLDRSTPLDGGQIYRYKPAAPPSDTDPGEIGQNPAPPSFWLRNPLDVSRLGKSERSASRRSKKEEETKKIGVDIVVSWDFWPFEARVATQH